MSKFWDDVKSAIVDGYIYAADKAEEMTQIGRAKVDILSTNRRIASAMSDLGGRVFELHDDDKASEILDDASVLSTIERIKDERLELDRLKAEIAEIREMREQAREEDAADDESADDESTGEAGSQE